MMSVIQKTKPSLQNWRWGISWILLFAPLPVTLTYWPSDHWPIHPMGIYAASMTAATSFFDLCLYRKLGLIAFVAFVMAIPDLIDAGVILLAAIVAGGVGTGSISLLFNDCAKFHFRSIIMWLSYHVIRVVIAFGLVWIALLIPLPTRGVCPFAGGDITGSPFTFTVITYMVVLPLVAIDWALYYRCHIKKGSLKATG